MMNILSGKYCQKIILMIRRLNLLMHCPICGKKLSHAGREIHIFKEDSHLMLALRYVCHHYQTTSMHLVTSDIINDCSIEVYKHDIQEYHEHVMSFFGQEEIIFEDLNELYQFMEISKSVDSKAFNTLLQYLNQLEGRKLKAFH